MIGYPFISELFKNVLAASNAMQGRFYDCPNMGRELNSDELGQVIKDLFDPRGIQKKYPIVLHMPPVSSGNYTKADWEKFRSVLIFLNTTYYTGTNQVMNPNKATGKSTHTIPQDWHDMKRCAVNFVQVLDKVARTKGLIKDKFRLSQDRDRIITPVSQVGADKASGVIMQLEYSVYNGCELEDYDEEDIADITIPESDSHPEHQL